MASVLSNLRSAILLSVALLMLVMLGFHYTDLDKAYLVPWFVFFHVLNGIMWIGLLYYFNFVQIPVMPTVPAELKPAVSRYIAPEALFWFRWAALGTVLTGLLVSVLKGYGHEALTFQPGFRVIGLGMYLGLVMAANVWFLIWPNQKIALGIVDADAAAKVKAGRIAMLVSRTNTVLSLPMLYCMVTQFYLPK